MPFFCPFPMLDGFWVHFGNQEKRTSKNHSSRYHKKVVWRGHLSLHLGIPQTQGNQFGHGDGEAEGNWIDEGIREVEKLVFSGAYPSQNTRQKIQFPLNISRCVLKNQG